MRTSNLLQQIEHFVVLMLENRSFDHMLGYLYQDSNNVSPLGHPFEGLTGEESNPDSGGNPIRVFKITLDMENAYFMPGADPGEGYFNTNEQLFGNHLATQAPPGKENSGFVKNFAYSLQWESKDGWSILPGTRDQNIMGMFTPEMLPVLSGLAKGYAVCDHWYCSVPTETLPNRAFLVMGTSQGRLNDKDKVYTAPTIFNHLSNHGHSWAIYGYDAMPLSRASYADITHADDCHFGQFQDFKEAASSGQLANFTLLEPQWGKGGNSQHPNYDVAKGEALIKEVYDTLRQSPNWEKTLLIITYDEHGGCYDHVMPPANAVTPDQCVGQNGFDFTRYGVRVPTVLVSPLIEAGTVFRVPENSTPLDHTSILKTVEERFGLSALTQRDSAAPSIGGVLTRDRPRTDNPIEGIDAPTSGKEISYDDKPDHLQILYAETMRSLPLEQRLRKAELRQIPAFRNSDEAMQWSNERYHRYFEHYWKHNT